MSTASPPLNDTPWEYYDKQSLHPILRRRKLIGRVRVTEAEWPTVVSTRLKTSNQEFVGRIATAFEWLTGSNLTPPAAWEAWRTQNSCIYMTPLGQQPWRFRRSDRYFDEVLSADAAGLCATELALNWSLAGSPVFSRPEAVRFARRLADFRHMHPEGARVSSVLD